MQVISADAHFICIKLASDGVWLCDRRKRILQDSVCVETCSYGGNINCLLLCSRSQSHSALIWMFHSDNSCTVKPPCARCFFGEKSSKILHLINLVVVQHFSSTLFISLFKPPLAPDQNNLVCLNRVDVKANSSPYLALIGRQQQLLCFTLSDANLLNGAFCLFNGLMGWMSVFEDQVLLSLITLQLCLTFTAAGADMTEQFKMLLLFWSDL